MPFIYRCENCNDEQETCNSFELDEMLRGCERCGQEGCENCINGDDHCDDCQKEVDAEKEAQEEEGEESE